jgi:predicted acylesterase/phospholipase RssA
MESGTTRVHLVLSAGGIKALSYIGTLSVLAEHGISFASVSTCSAGTLVGALICAGKTLEEIEKSALEIDFASYAGKRAVPKPLGALSFVKWPFAQYRQTGFPELFCELVQDNPRFKDLEIPFATAGVDIVSNRILVYSSETHPNMLVAEAIRIAVALPLMYPPHVREGRVVVDAAVVSQSPVWLATAHDDELPIVVLKPATLSDVHTPKNIFAYLETVFLSSVGSRDDYVTKQIPRVRMFEIDCGSIRDSQFSISRREKEYLIARGRTCAEDALPHLGEDLGNMRVVPYETSTSDAEDDIAERYGESLMNRFHSRLSDLVREHVFISYSHKDREWLEKLQIYLKPYMRNASIAIWDDKEIKSGAKWQQEIENALASAKVAVLLVSPDFLASDFIADRELPTLLDAAESRGLTILWVPLRHSAYKETEIARYQAASGCDPSHPLSSLPEHEQDRVFLALCEEIKELMST